MYTDAHSRNVVLAAVCLGLFVVQVDTTALNLALPQIGRSLHLGIGSLQWIADLYNLAYASLLLTGGLLGDRYGRKRLYAIGVALFVIGSAICALAGSLPALLDGRLVQGIGAALEVPATVAIISATYPDRAERSRAMGVWASVSGLALAFGPSAGGWLVAHAGWQSIFILNLPVGAAALWLTLGRVAESQLPSARRIDLPGQLLAILLFASLTYAVIESPDGGLAAPLARACLILAPVSLCLFLLREALAGDPMIPLRFFRKPAFSGAVVAAAAMTFGMYGLLFLLGLYLESIAGFSSFLAGLAYLPTSIAFIISSTLAGRLSPRAGAGSLMTAGLLLIAAGLLLLARLSSAEQTFRLIVALSLTGIGMGLNTGPAVTLAVGSVEPHSAGIASGVINLARMLGATLGVALFGAVAAGRATFVEGMHAAFLVGGAVALFGAAVAAVTERARSGARSRS